MWIFQVKRRSRCMPRYLSSSCWGIAWFLIWIARHKFLRNVNFTWVHFCSYPLRWEVILSRCRGLVMKTRTTLLSLSDNFRFSFVGLFGVFSHFLWNWILCQGMSDYLSTVLNQNPPASVFLIGRLGSLPDSWGNSNFYMAECIKRKKNKVNKEKHLL